MVSFSTSWSVSLIVYFLKQYIRCVCVGEICVHWQSQEIYHSKFTRDLSTRLWSDVQTKNDIDVSFRRCTVNVATSLRRSADGITLPAKRRHAARYPSVLVPGYQGPSGYHKPIGAPTSLPRGPSFQGRPTLFLQGVPALSLSGHHAQDVDARFAWEWNPTGFRFLSVSTNVTPGIVFFFFIKWNTLISWKFEVYPKLRQCDKQQLFM